MAKNKYQPVSALREHMLEGNHVSILEAILLFGVQSPNVTFTQFKKEGFRIESQKVSMAKILRRTNQFAICKPPENLPYKEIFVSEYWIIR